MPPVTDLSLSDIPYEATTVADALTQGDPVHGWKGDPRLSLHVGVIRAAQDGVYHGKFRRRGDVIGKCYQVMRHNEDGTDLPILQRRLDQWHEIIPAMVQIDPRTPGHVDTMTRVERANTLEEKHRSDDFQEAHGEATEHLWKLVSDRQNGRNTTRQVPGRNPGKQD